MCAPTVKQTCVFQAPDFYDQNCWNQNVVSDRFNVDPNVFQVKYTTAMFLDWESSKPLLAQSALSVSGDDWSRHL